MGYLEMADQVDTFIVLDDVQFIKRDWVCRNRISNKEQSWQWLTVPVKKAPRNTNINMIRICYESNWNKTIYETIRHVYSKSKCFDSYANELKEVLYTQYEYLIQLNINLLSLIMRWLNFRQNFILSSNLQIQGKKEEKLIGLCKAVGAIHYLANNGSKPYIHPDLFENEGISFQFQDYRHPEYAQFGGDFVSYLSVLDVIFHHGSCARDIIVSGRNVKTD